MHMHPNISLHDLRQGLELQVALRRTGGHKLFICGGILVLGFFSGAVGALRFLLVVLRQFAIVLVPLLLIVLRVGKGLAVTGDIAHTSRRRLMFFAVDAFRILAAGHLESVDRAGKLHRLVGHALHILDHDRTAADEIRRAGQNLHGRHAAFERSLESGVLRPDGMLGPNVRRDRSRRLVAIIESLDRGAGVYAQVRVDIDEAWRYPFALRIDDARVPGRGKPFADRLDTAVCDQHIGAIEALTGTREHGRALDQYRRTDGHLIRRCKRLRGKSRGHGAGHRRKQRDARYHVHFLTTIPVVMTPRRSTVEARVRDYSANLSSGEDFNGNSTEALRPARSSSSKRANSGLSRSSTPSRRPRWTSGTTISERDAASQAMCPGNSLTSGTTKISRRSAAVPQTPRPMAMRTHATLP